MEIRQRWGPATMKRRRTGSERGVDGQKARRPEGEKARAQPASPPHPTHENPRTELTWPCTHPCRASPGKCAAGTAAEITRCFAIPAYRFGRRGPCVATWKPWSESSSGNSEAQRRAKWLGAKVSPLVFPNPSRMPRLSWTGRRTNKLRHVSS